MPNSDLQIVYEFLLIAVCLKFISGSVEVAYNINVSKTAEDPKVAVLCNGPTAGFSYPLKRY